MKQKIASLTIFSYVLINSFAHAAHLYKEVAISEQSIENNGRTIGFEIKVNKINIKNTAVDNRTQSDIGKIIWSIGPKDLTVPEELCNKHTFDLCRFFKDEECYAPCFRYGPRFLAYDEKANKIYFMVNSTAVGTTGQGPRFVFVGNVNTKEINLIDIIFGPIQAELSSSGRYIVFTGGNEITIFDNINKKSLRFGKDNTWRGTHKRLYSLGNIHWLSDSRFSYTESWRSDKFSDQVNDTVEHIYDIPTHKIIHSQKAL